MHGLGFELHCQLGGTLFLQRGGNSWMEVALIGKCTIASTSPPYLYFYCGCGLEENDGSEEPYLHCLHSGELALLLSWQG